VLGVLAAAAAGFAPAGASAGGPCGPGGGRVLARSGKLTVVKTPTDAWGCLPGHTPYQLASLASLDGQGDVLSVARALAKSGRYAGIEIHDVNSDLEIESYFLSSYDVVRRKLRFGSPDSGDDGARPDMVMTDNGALAWVDDGAPNTLVMAADRLGSKVDGTRTLDHAAKPSSITKLRASGNVVSWLHSGRLRHAKLKGS
jgi:hypothetical protein